MVAVSSIVADTPELRRSSYAEIGTKLDACDSTTLLELLDSSSVKIGDISADLLTRRNKALQIIEAIESDKLKTAKGRVRALSILRKFGASCPDALRAYRHALHDGSSQVIDWALFGLVFMRDIASLPAIENLLASAKLGRDVRARMELAKKALEADDPYVYFPHYSDPNNIWKLE